MSTTLLARYRRTWRLVAGAALVLGAAGFLTLRQLPAAGQTMVWIAFATYVVGLLAFPRVVWRRLLGKHQARLRGALEAEDVPTARRLADELGAAGYGKWPGFVVTEASVLMIEERWQEAHDLLARADRDKLDVSSRLLAMGSLAWALVQLGRGDEAIALASAVLAVADARLRPYCLGTLGAAHQVAGRPAEAVRLLEEALATQARPERPAAEAARALYLGEALRALGRTDDARAAYERAVRVAPGSRYTRRAQDQLATL